MTSWIEVSKERLTANFRAARGLLEGQASVLAVVKANGYGHGAALCAPVLAAAGANWLGVTDATEGIAIRAALTEAGIGLEYQTQILVMCGHLPDEAPMMALHNLTPVAWNRPQLEALALSAGAGSLPVHLEIDTGMSRQGVAAGDDLRQLLHKIADEPRLRLDGVLTHFASAEVAGSARTAEQRAHFEAAVQIIGASGLRPRWVHAGNTSFLDNGAEEGNLRWLCGQAKRLDAQPMVREGLGLYGYSLPLEGLVASDGEASRLRSALHLVMTWKTRILTFNSIAPGTCIGYNGIYQAARQMRLALLPVGYADGLRRQLSSSTGKAGGWVMVNGTRAPIVGRISMNLTTVDVTHIDGLNIGDEVVLLGVGVTAEDHAALAATIPYEILCGIRAPLVPV